MPEPGAPARVVLDVNALIDGAYPNLRRTRTPGGRAPKPDEANPGRLLALFREDRGRQLFLSTHIITETLRVLQLAELKRRQLAAAPTGPRGFAR